MQGMTRITCDLFNIAVRMKEMDSRYMVYFNNATERFEVHLASGEGQPSPRTLAFAVPFSVLDARTIEHAMKTRIERAQELEQEIFLHNKRIEQSASDKMDEEIERLGDMLRFAHGTSEEVRFTRSPKWI